MLFLAAPRPPEDSIQEIMQENGRGGEDEITKDSPTIPVSKGDPIISKFNYLRAHFYLKLCRLTSKSQYLIKH